MGETVEKACDYGNKTSNKAYSVILFIYQSVYSSDTQTGEGLEEVFDFR